MPDRTIMLCRDQGESGGDPMTTWIRSTRCVGGDCVEATYRDGCVLVRDSKQPDGPHLAFSPTEWAAILSMLIRGETPFEIARLPDGAAVWTGRTDGRLVLLTFDGDEWATFVEAARAGQFRVERLAEAVSDA